MPDDEFIENLLSFDPLYEAEKLTRKRNAPETDALGFRMMMTHGAQKDAVLQELGDSTFRTDVPRYLKILELEGFTIVRNELCGDPEYPKNRHYICWHPDGILLNFDTYWNNESINGATIYYVWKPSVKEFWHHTSSGGCIETTPVIWQGSHDAREALRFHLRRLRENGEFLKSWPSQPFLWLLNYMDSRGGDKTYDYEAINRQRIRELPEDIRAALGQEKP